MSSHPLSARKTRAAAVEAVRSVEQLNAGLQALGDKHNGLVKDAAEAFQSQSKAINGQAALFFSRGFVGRLKYLVFGK
jgi:hypothetical protein